LPQRKYCTEQLEAVTICDYFRYV